MSILQKKICLLGDSEVGKTSLIRRFVESRFEDKYLSTIGVKISRKSLIVQDKAINLLLWDVAGVPEFGHTESAYLRGASGALIVCDLTRASTLVSFQKYAHQLHIVNPGVQIVFLANKVDLVAERVIETVELDEMCRFLDGSYLMSSAKTGEQVEEAFMRLTEMVLSC